MGQCQVLLSTGQSGSMHPSHRVQTQNQRQFFHLGAIPSGLQQWFRHKWRRRLIWWERKRSPKIRGFPLADVA
ncbi:hypothetical protein MT325_m433R [Paramecium bursaria chlorella virus MT325]|uniref:Uncharacterized protein m433R n=1 Tax=Paramecium bursaria Chlorella virus MT325 TaxID=346932 RepID=A7IUG3_PBCVM|nr:hypothetical protein MT325_m433R [Paramecium bursaria chlorella virus MT325]